MHGVEHLVLRPESIHHGVREEVGRCNKKTDEEALEPLVQNAERGIIVDIYREILDNWNAVTLEEGSLSRFVAGEILVQQRA